MSEKQIDAILSVLAEEGCLPYMASIRAIAPEPGPMTDEQKEAFAQANVEAERKNREFARRILRAATQREEGE